jgi:hypothetical protein
MTSSHIISNRMTPLCFTLITYQKYDEMALNTRLDKAKTEAGMESTAMGTGTHTIDQVGEALAGKLDVAKQKEALLTYVGYVSARHDEILSALEKDQEKERCVGAL